MTEVIACDHFLEDCARQGALAKLGFPASVAVDGAGNVLIADVDNERIRVVAVSTGTFYGRKMRAGDIYAIAGNGTRGFSGDGGPATKAEFDGPSDVTLDPAGGAPKHWRCIRTPAACWPASSVSNPDPNYATCNNASSLARLSG